MSFKILFLVLLYSIGCELKEICYNDLGCFNDNFPFSGTIQRPIAFLPESPEKISTQFILYNRKISGNEIISATNFGNSFDPKIKTKIIIHGFFHNAYKKWVLDMKDALLFAEDVNVITIDWSKGNSLPYTQATANTQIVGAEISKFIKNFVDARGAREEDFHCIGHSLGSHICGYAGKRLTNLGRITALDPAGPYFENTDPIVRLTKDDAQFVDAIHTDGSANLLLGLGLMQPLGHVDYYPNGGKNQPECPATSGKILAAIFNLASLDLDSFEDSTVCSHSSAFYYFTASISKCQFISYPCEKQSDFDNGKCLTCSSKGCNRMGYYASNLNDLGTLYLNTQPPLKGQFCKQNYVLRLYSNSKANSSIQAKGKFQVYFETSNELSSNEIFDDSATAFKLDSIETKLVSLNQGLVNEVENLYISYTKTTNILTSWLYDNEWSFKYVELLNGEKQVVSKYCPTEQSIQSTKTVKFIKC